MLFCFPVIIYPNEKQISLIIFQDITILFFFNLFVSPVLMERQVKEVDYGTFMDMIDDGKIGKVEIEDNQIVFTNKDEDKIYKTGVMEDPTLTERLHKRD